MVHQLTFDGFWGGLERRTRSLVLGPEADTDGLAFKRASLAVAAAVRAQGWQTVGLHTHDSLAFATGVFGIVLAGAMPEILPHTQPGFVSRLRAELDGLVTDYSLPAACGIPSVNMGTAGETRQHLADSAWPETARISFRTSGSSGDPKRVEKSLRAIEVELNALETRFGEHMPDTFAGTVDHQHYYGATVRVLWPLLGGRRLLRRLMRHPSDVMSTAPQGVAVVSSPTFLVGAADLLRPEDLSTANSKMFSAGAPLPQETVERLNAGDDWLIAEIFGSTESGAICSRIRHGDYGEDAWTPLPGVRLSVNDGRIFAAWNAADDSEAVELGDSGERLPDGRLRFLGRRDRIVKVREKRVSLAAVETELLGHPFVREVAAVDLQRRELSELGVVVVPTDAGFARLESGGHRALANQLQKRLRNSFDSTTLPRKWRFVRALPRNGIAKVTKQSLIDLFAGPADVPNAFPEILADSADGLTRTVDLRIGAELRWFLGHFPGVPVLPGVVQIDWAAHFGAPLTRNAGRFERLQRVKFNHALQPGIDVCLALRFDARKRSLGFVYSNREKTFSSGHFVYV